MNAIDTNIWIYAHDTRDAHKQLVAQTLIATVRPLKLPWQIGCEFIAACRKLVAAGFDENMAWSALGDMQAMADEILLPTPQLWQDTRSLQARHSISFWDALLAQACITGGVLRLYSEDMGSPRVLDGLTLINPFRPASP